jgi:hypothetical protein
MNNLGARVTAGAVVPWARALPLSGEWGEE